MNPHISHIEIFKMPIAMEPFVIATEIATIAQNTLVRIHTIDGQTGTGECSAFPMLTGETQATCFEVGKELARKLKGKDATDIRSCMNELDTFIARNTTIKSAFDMALHDIAARYAGLPLYAFLGGRKKEIVTDLTIGIDTPERMAEKAVDFVSRGVKTIKVKLGKNGSVDVERIRAIRDAIGYDFILRIDANQGWDPETAISTLKKLEQYRIQFCEQPIHHHLDDRLPEVRRESPIPVMADESVCNHHDARRLIHAGACDAINIKLAKSGGILEAISIADTAASAGIPCMLGGMLESRLALTAKVHLAMAHDNIIYYDLDTCLLGQLEDPVVGGAIYDGFNLQISDAPGIAADIHPDFLANCMNAVI
jgi:L-alanine-DL-glutamate epimerase-like enolase superfamily enzyme